MNALKYQLKNISRDKMCILTFLLPIVAGIALHFLSGLSLAAVSENSFGIIENELEEDAAEWLAGIGHVTAFETRETLEAAVNEPSTQMIGVLKSGGGIETLLSGDELTLNVTVAKTLPQLFSERELPQSYRLTIAPNAGNDDGLKSLLTAITLVTAMFMGCTFNAMSIIGEKEDGVALLNEILPMTAQNYMVQKIAVGFIGAVVSSMATALICMRLDSAQIFSLILLIVLSSFLAALAGLFIGRCCRELMTGITCIKLAMIVFIAPPVLVYLTAPEGGIVYAVSCLLPSGAAFYGLMALMDGNAAIGALLFTLAVHCAVWFTLYLALSKRSRLFHSGLRSHISSTTRH